MVLRDESARLSPETIVLIADDQNENISEASLPQVAIYTVGDFKTVRAGGLMRERRASNKDDLTSTRIAPNVHIARRRESIRLSRHMTASGSLKERRR